MDGEFARRRDSENTQMRAEKVQRCADSSPAMAGTGGGCFDCNICLDFAVEPVVTLCGHLYCWPCIYRWLQLENTSPPLCPVCKAALSQTTLVPLYGRGHTSGKQDVNANIPRRPSVQHRGRTMAASLVEPELSRSTSSRQRQHQYQQNHHTLLDGNLVPTVSTRMLHPILGGTAVAVLPWVFGEHVSGHGLYYSSPYYVVGGGDSPRAQRHEMEVRRSLHRISIFLFCCVILCLLLF